MNSECAEWERCAAALCLNVYHDQTQLYKNVTRRTLALTPFKAMNRGCMHIAVTH